jgi:hypothetical protein
LNLKSCDNENLTKNLRHHCEVEVADFDFEKNPVDVLDAVRNCLFEKEQEGRRIEN